MINEKRKYFFLIGNRKKEKEKDKNKARKEQIKKKKKRKNKKERRRKLIKKQKILGGGRRMILRKLTFWLHGGVGAEVASTLAVFFHKKAVGDTVAHLFPLVAFLKSVDVLAHTLWSRKHHVIHNMHQVVLQ